MDALHFKQTLLALFTEAHGLLETNSYFLDHGKAGLFGQMGRIDAATASARFAKGHETIAGHCQHLLFTLNLVFAMERGEQVNPDWATSWVPDTVTDDEWAQLQADLRTGYDTLMNKLNARDEWPQQAVGSSMMLLAHTVYHVGVIDKMITIHS